MSFIGHIYIYDTLDILPQGWYEVRSSVDKCTKQVLFTILNDQGLFEQEGVIHITLGVLHGLFELRIILTIRFLSKY